MPNSPDFIPDSQFVPDAAPVAQGQSAPAQAGPDFIPDDQFVSDEDKHGTALEQLKTVGEGLASGATLGLSKVAETKLLGVKPEDIAGREEANPWESGISQVGGAVAGLLGSEELLAPIKGAQLLGKGAQAGAEALGLGKVGAGIVGAGAEGAAIAGANQATDDWSQNKPLDAGKIAASAGWGLLLGGGGAGLMEGASTISKASPVQKSLDFLGKFAPMGEAEGGTGISANIVDTYNAAAEGVDRNKLVKDLADHLTTLRQSAYKSANEMYEKAGQAKLSDALKDINLPDAIDIAAKTVQSTDDLIATTGSFEAGDNIFSERTKNQLQRKGMVLVSDITKAETPIEVHTALTDYATSVDDMIKFNKTDFPTDQGKIDQQLLNQVRQNIRGNLANTDVWGQAAPIYQEMSTNYANYKNSLGDFDKAFTVKRGAGGDIKRVVDPVKVSSFLNKTGDATQALPKESFDNFIASASKMARYTQDYDGFVAGKNDLVKQLEEVASNVKDINRKKQILNVTNGIKHGEGLSGQDFALIETLGEIPGGKPAIATWNLLKRYLGSGGSYRTGQDLYRAVKVARALANHADSATKTINNKARLIFSGASSQEREGND